MSRPIDADKLLQEVEESRKCNPHKNSKIAWNHEIEHLHFMSLVSRQPIVCDMEQLSIDCIAQHLKTFHEQAVFDKTADFGEPCSSCPHAMKECRLNWPARMKPLFSRTNIQIRLDYLELPSTKDSRDDLHMEKEGNSHCSDSGMYPSSNQKTRCREAEPPDS